MKMTDYFYLISSLPNLTPNAVLPFDLLTLFQKINDNLTPEDQDLFQWLIFPTDIENVVSSYESRAGETKKYTHQIPSIYTQADISESSSRPAQLHDFIFSVMIQAEEHKYNSSMLEEKLWASFYASIEELNDPFLSRYYSRFRHVKTIVWYINQKKSQDLMGNTQLPESFLLQSLDRAQGQLSSITEYTSLGELIPLLAKGDFVAAEELLQKFLWAWLENETRMDYFNRNAVFVYFLKFQMNSRWQRLDKKKGGQRLQALRAKYQEQFQQLTH